MGWWELFFIAVGLSMDAFAAAICKGLSARRLGGREVWTTGFYFGGFQALMPLLGYWLGSRFQELMESVDHWVAFVLLGMIGLGMLRGAQEETMEVDASFTPKAMLPLAVATSIDALAVGVTLAFLKVPIGSAAGLIGATTFLLSAAGVKMGERLGQRRRAQAERIGGLVLIFMGIKILLEHTGMI